MRCDCRPRVPSRSRFLGNAPGNRASPFGDRARRFAWPARGTERFLGRDVSKYPAGGKEETTPSFHGNMNRPEPVELFGAVSAFILIRKTTEEWTPLLEPSRCGSSEHPAARR